MQEMCTVCLGSIACCTACSKFSQHRRSFAKVREFARMEGTQRNCQNTDLALAYEKSLGQSDDMHLEFWRASFQGDILSSMVPARTGPAYPFCLSQPGYS